MSDTSAKAGWRMVGHLGRRAATNGKVEQRSPVTDLIRTLADERDEWRGRAEKAEAALAAFAEPDHWFDVEDAIDEQLYRAWRGPVAEPEAFARAALRNDGGNDD